MKEKSLLFGIAVFLWALANVSIVFAEELPQIIISEISIADNDTDDDFIELYNTGDTIVSLNNWYICRRTKNNTSPCTGSNLIKKFSSNDTILPKKFLLWANSKGKKYIDLADTKTADSLTDNNSLALLDDTDTPINSVTWGSGHTDPFSPSILYPDNPPKNKSLTRNVATPVFSLSDKPTPTNSKDETYKDPPPTIYDNLIRLNEIFPNPSEKGEANEFIELYNDSDKIVSLIDWIIRKDYSENGQYLIKAPDFPEGTDIAARGFFLIPRSISSFAMTNSNKTISLHDPNGKEINAIHYTKTKENVSLNYTSTGWRGGTPTPGAENQINNLPETNEKVPKKGYRGVPVTFNAKGKDADGDKLKYDWDFGDDHGSRKANTSHAYEKNGTYTVTLKTDDGREEMLETFTIEIRSYTYPKIRITSFAPNPTGNDTDNEWLMLGNRGKKSVNLKDFGIATGWKNLVNHPIRENFIIEPKQEAKLTREISLFTLANQKGKVELRAPDGKVLQKIKYKLEKSIAENAVYIKKKGERWNFEMSDIENVSENENETSLPASTSEQIPEENPAPASDIPAPDEPQNDQETEGEVLGASITESDAKLSRDRRKHDQQWMKLISLGTRAALPENIEFSPESESIFAEQAPKHSDISLMQETLLDLNASLNNMFNNSLE